MIRSLFWLIKTAPIVRHVRALRFALIVEDRARQEARLGIGHGVSQVDADHAHSIWRGEE